MTSAHRLGPAMTLGFFLAPALLSTGCSGDPGPPPGDTRLAAALIVPDDSRRLLTNAELFLLSRCMRRNGFRYTYPLIGPDEKFSDPMERELRRDDVEKARREGYGISDPRPEKASHRFDRQEEYRRSLTKRQREKYEIALYGRPRARTIKTEIPGFLTASAPTEGCLAEAQGELYGDYNRWFRVSTFVHTRFNAIGERMKADPKYIGVTRDWQTCMAKKGYAYKDFSEVTHDSLDKFSGRPEKKREEIRLAVDDAECDRQVGRSKVHRGLFDKYTQAWAKQNEANVIAYRDLTAQAVQRAKPLV